MWSQKEASIRKFLSLGQCTGQRIHDVLECPRVAFKGKVWAHKFVTLRLVSTISRSETSITSYLSRGHFKFFWLQ